MANPLDLIDTIVVVMMENRSFDHVLGFLSHESFDGRKDVDGLRQHSPDFDWDNSDDDGEMYAPTATPDCYVPQDMPHGRDEIATQMNHGSMLGFINSYFAYQKVDRSPVPMRFCRPECIPITAALARNYTVCDRWFASIPDDTFPNRLMSLSGYTNIDDTSVVKPPLHLLPDQTTIFDWLNNKHKTYKIYVDANPITNVGPPASMLLMENQWGNVIRNAHTLDTLAGHWNNAPAPDVIYCEPFFNDFATAIGVHGNCNHPPLPMAYGELFLKKVYTALTSNPARWARTMLIICYDEHGGFFDHVAPPAMTYGPPKGSRWLQPKPFDTLGIRVPSMIVSPLVDAKTASHDLFDHTSILQLMVEKFGTPADLAYFGDAPNRKNSGIRSLATALTRQVPRMDDILTLPDPPPPAGPATTPSISQVAEIFRQVIALAPKLKLGL
ncbi:MAG: Phospholipase 4 precursor [Myxococcales bacterium]|nr:Phospholipase 4 precursor [Myxococcales bacterium]